MGGMFGTVNGHDKVAAMICTFIAALPDLKATEQVAVAEGDYVFVWNVVEGTLRGGFLAPYGFGLAGTRHSRLLCDALLLQLADRLWRQEQCGLRF